MNRAQAVVIALVVVALLGLGAWALSGGSPPPPSTALATDAGTTRPPLDAYVALQPRRARSDDRPDILLFTIDTVRVDHLSLYRYDRPTTPYLERLASRGARFDRAYSTSSWTLPAVVSLLTGVMPSQHGVFHSRLDDAGALEQEPISPELPSLAATLQAAGYRTIGITANEHLTPALGFGRGFDEYVSLGFADLDAVVPELDRQITALAQRDQPYFLWVHVLDPHAPHRPTPWLDTFRAPSLPHYPQLDDVFYAEALGIMIAAEQNREWLDYEIDVYDSEIRAVDEALSTLVGRLDDGHLAVVVTADHGEELFDHGRMGHGHTLFEEVFHVPLVVALPGARAASSDVPVSIIDVLPTLLEVAGVSAMPEGIAGRSLVPATRQDPFPEVDVFGETGRDETVRGIVAGNYKYAERVDPAPELQVLYDVVMDPHEEHDLLAAEPERAATLRERLHAMVRDATARRPAVEASHVEISDTVQEHLRALGYAQ